jgi:hypothetical protein
MFRSRLFMIAIPVLILVTIGVMSAYSAEISTLLSSWIEGNPRMLVKLEIRLPQVNADRCAVSVKRFPTMYNPTKDGYVELVYIGLHPPGSTVEVKNTLFAYVARYKTDPRTNELAIDYYEPQEYLVFVNCVRGNGTAFKWVRIVEVFPRNIIHTESVEVEGYYAGASEATYSRIIESAGSAQNINESSSTPSESNPFSCNLVIVEEGAGYKRGECYTWVKGPVLYSISGLNTSYVLYTYPKKSAVYLEVYGDSEMCVTNCRSEGQVQWQSAGKKLTPSSLTHATAGLSGYYKDTVYFYVRYVYIWGITCDTFAGMCLQDWTLYPANILNLVRTAEEPSLPYSRYLYIPSSPPNYASTGSTGESQIDFARDGSSETNTPVSGITISFTYANVWTVSLTIHFYKAVREDTQYTTPLVKIYAVRNYWWWYKDNDPRNYEILVAPR